MERCMILNDILTFILSLIVILRTYKELKEN